MQAQPARSSWDDGRTGTVAGAHDDHPLCEAFYTAAGRIYDVQCFTWPIDDDFRFVRITSIRLASDFLKEQSIFQNRLLHAYETI